MQREGRRPSPPSPNPSWKAPLQERGLSLGRLYPLNSAREFAAPKPNSLDAAHCFADLQRWVVVVVQASRISVLAEAGRVAVSHQ